MVVLFLTYLTAIVVPYLRRQPEPPGDAARFDWHFVVPCLNEETVIGQCLAGLRSQFPAAHVWVVDDASMDGTAAVVSAAADTCELVHLIRRRLPQAQTGKGHALNAAYRVLSEYLPSGADRSRVIVCVVDADGMPAPGALDQVAGPGGFGSPDVGAVQIAVLMSNRGGRGGPAGRGPVGQWFARYLVRMQDLEFRTTIAAMQTLRDRTGSVGMGGNGQFTRMSALDEVAARYGHPWDDALLEDYELGLRVLLSGYRNRYCHDTYVEQEAVTSLRRLLAQRARWSQGNMQCTRYIPQILLSEHMSNAGAVESIYYLILPFIQIVGIVVWPAMYLAWVLRVTAADQGSVGALVGAWWLLILVAVMGVAPFAMWGPI